MRTAFVGKGGSGKTTLSALFSRHLARTDAPVVAIDADINQHLGVALGLEEDELPEVVPLSTRLGGIKEYLRGDNPRIASADAMVKTTPRGAAPACCGRSDPTRCTPATSGTSRESG
ncbi:hypothetical protein SVIO_024150 [Streptomyces violaceusniger]|uniref:CobQ/CobB/MinD/ParA nucleotide binding domain-containing protein n=1 Tax=Streptomyces violaceusniger TaxID=68280 RepID=A0A4D4KSY8_STRVO|nr:hypothetical protein SVIO_024150 [Streptomyces violaceusniger]